MITGLIRGLGVLLIGIIYKDKAEEKCTFRFASVMSIIPASWLLVLILSFMATSVMEIIFVVSYLIGCPVAIIIWAKIERKKQRAEKELYNNDL